MGPQGEYLINNVQRANELRWKGIVIIGNSSSGKTYLAQRLRDCFHLEIIHLDQLFWEPGGFNQKRPAAVVYLESTTLAQSKSWIVEGVFGELAQEFLPKADYLTWLDLDWATRSASLLKRGSESSKQLDQHWQKKTSTSCCNGHPTIGNAKTYARTVAMILYLNNLMARKFASKQDTKSMILLIHANGNKLM